MECWVLDANLCKFTTLESVDFFFFFFFESVLWPSKIVNIVYWKNEEIKLFCHFIKIILLPSTSFQSRSYPRNLGQHSVLARKGTFYEKRTILFVNGWVTQYNASYIMAKITMFWSIIIAALGIYWSGYSVFII